MLVSYPLKFIILKNFHPMDQDNNLNSQWVALIPFQFSKSKQQR